MAKEGPLEKFSNFSRNDPIARLIVQYFHPCDFLFRDYRRVSRALAAQKRRTRWRASQETAYLRLWLSMLFTVVEGYHFLALTDPEIDRLLQYDDFDSLRKFRNGTFHYQPDPKKQVQFFLGAGNKPDSAKVEWAKQLHEEFDRFFKNYRLRITLENLLKNADHEHMISKLPKNIL